jgi:hypothetical protein
VNIVFLTSMQGAWAAPTFIHSLLSIAAHSVSLSEDGIEVTGAMSTSADNGWRAVMAMASYMHIDSIFCFGKTGASLGAPDLLDFKLEYVRLPDRLDLTNVMRLPSAADRWWYESTEDVTRIAESIKPMLLPAPISAPTPYIAWPVTAWN